MAIKNLTDRQTIKPRLPRLGKLRKGGEMVATGKKDKFGKDIKKYGPDLDHFRFTSDSPEVLAAFRSVYGDNPQFINALLFYGTVEENFPSWIECWDASGLLFRSDGENWLIWREGSEYKQGKKPHIDHKDQIEVGRFEFLIPELLHLGFVGTVTMETHSNHDLRNITAVLMAAEGQKSLKGASFVLRRVEQEISTPGWGDRSDKRSVVKKWLVRLEAPRQMFAGLLEAPGVDYIDSPELLMIEAPEMELSQAEPETHPQPSPSPAEPQPAPVVPPTAKAKAPDWPASGPAKDFCDEVQRATVNYYTNSYHLTQTIGGFGNLNNKDNWDSKLSIAVDHAANKRAETMTPALFAMDVQSNGGAIDL